ncbi:uncharacterized protein N7518_004553 [Penicillium psychrosexuale]|uniref:uncharacterized protein n=1 Tax=Penicillium psychrosexuale TaxID=1002107 RepID=UPI002544EE13|nr:uncharacterized protein N7518_004553 [Penicillium psychrosexuale]KAJ5796013.1 hypothetical protein N7518_004553 [Penicillium psychrosexuale]
MAQSIWLSPAYNKLKRRNKNNIPTSPPAPGLSTGISRLIGAVLGNSSDISNIRMLPPHLRRTYRHIFDAWMKREEG